MEISNEELSRRYADENLSAFLLRQLKHAVNNSVLENGIIDKRIEAIQLSIRQERGVRTHLDEEVIQMIHLSQAKYIWAHLFQKSTSGRIELKELKALEKQAKYHVMKAGNKHTADSIGMSLTALKELYIRQAQLWLTYSRLHAEDPEIDISLVPDHEIIPAVMLAGQQLTYIETSDRELGALLHKNAMSILKPHIKELLVLSGHYACFRVDDYLEEVVDPVLERLKVSRKTAGLYDGSNIMNTAYTRQCKYNWKYFKRNVDRLEDPQKFFSESILYYLEAAKLTLQDVEITSDDIRTMSNKVSKLRTQYKKERERSEHGEVVWRV